MSQQALQRSHLGQSSLAPQGPGTTTKNDKEGHDKDRRVGVGNEEGLGIGLVGEDCLDSTLLAHSRPAQLHVL